MVWKNSTVKLRLHPTAEQAAAIDRTLECCRWLWNEMLSDEREFYFAADVHYIPTPARYKKGAPFLKEADSQALATVHTDLRRAFQRFFDHPERYGYPAFKRPGAKTAYTTYASSASARLYCTREGVRLPKLGIVPATFHRRPQPDWKLKSATVSRTATGKYFCALLFEHPAAEPPEVQPEPGKTVGLNFSAQHFYADSDGNFAQLSEGIARTKKKLARLQRQLSRMERGSKNYKRQQQKVRLAYERLANQRMDFIHKESRRLADACDAVCVRGDDLQEISKKLQFGSASDSGFGKFRLCLGYKLARQGKPLVVIDRSCPTARTCHSCGFVREALPLGVRVWTCPACGAVLPREVNAAKNIRAQGLEQLRAGQRS